MLRMGVQVLGRRVSFVAVSLSFVGLYFAAGAPAPLLVVYEAMWGFAPWLLTVAFSAYSIGLIVSLLVTGSISDHLGRRPVLIVAFVVMAASMSMFVFAPHVGWLIAARTVQGIATGAATSALSAMIVELAPERRRSLGPVIAAASPPVGIAIGVVGAGAAVQWFHSPEVVVYATLTAVMLLGLLIVAIAPETLSSKPGVFRSLVPRLSVPAPARLEFAASVPVSVATWMLVALFIGLAPLVLRDVFHLPGGLLSGLIVSVQPGLAAITGVLFGRVAARKTTMIGGAIVVFGVGVIVTSFILGWLPLLVIGAAISGTGFGASSSGPLRILAPLAPAHQRAELFAAYYLVSYAAFGIPVVLAGFLIDSLGLQLTSIAYGVVTLLVAATGFVAQARLARSDARAG